jgi:hypothetical protein
MTDAPTPGSTEAVKQGCKCPVIDNRYGRGIRDGSDEFWFNLTCPLHGFSAEDDND